MIIETILVFAAILLGACLPSILWILFFLKEELHPVPSRFLIYTFGAGAISSLFVLVAQFFFHEYVDSYITGVFIPLAGLALIEEAFKFSAAFFAVYHTNELKEPEDAIILAVTAALGFASIENIFALAGSAETFNFFSLYSIGYVIIVRFIGATMLHALAAGIIGYYWARGGFRGRFWLNISFGVLAATAVHAIFNFLVLEFQDKNLLVYPALFLVTILFFVLTNFEAVREEEKEKEEIPPPSPGVI